MLLLPKWVFDGQTPDCTGDIKMLVLFHVFLIRGILWIYIAASTYPFEEDELRYRISNEPGLSSVAENSFDSRIAPEASIALRNNRNKMPERAA